jgi:hypothetical protein
MLGDKKIHLTAVAVFMLVNTVLITQRITSIVFSYTIAAAFLTTALLLCMAFLEDYRNRSRKGYFHAGIILNTGLFLILILSFSIGLSMIASTGLGRHGHYTLLFSVFYRPIIAAVVISMTIGLALSYLTPNKKEGGAQ